METGCEPRCDCGSPCCLQGGRLEQSWASGLGAQARERAGRRAGNGPEGQHLEWLMHAIVEAHKMEGGL